MSFRNVGGEIEAADGLAFSGRSGNYRRSARFTQRVEQIQQPAVVSSPFFSPKERYMRIPTLPHRTSICTEHGFEYFLKSLRRKP